MTPATTPHSDVGPAGLSPRPSVGSTPGPVRRTGPVHPPVPILQAVPILKAVPILQAVPVLRDGSRRSRREGRNRRAVPDLR